MALWALFFVQQSPWTFYVYVTFPCYFWNQVTIHAAIPVGNFFLAKGRAVSSYTGYIIQATLIFGVLQGMVVSEGLF